MHQLYVYKDKSDKKNNKPYFMAVHGDWQMKKDDFVIQTSMNSCYIVESNYQRSVIYVNQ